MMTRGMKKLSQKKPEITAIFLQNLPFEVCDTTKCALPRKIDYIKTRCHDNSKFTQGVSFI